MLNINWHAFLCLEAENTIAIINENFANLFIILIVK